MDWIKRNKKKIAIVVIVLVIVLSLALTLSYGYKKYKEKRMKIGNDLYEKVHNLYFYGDGLKYKSEDGKTKITNYEIITDLVDEGKISEVEKVLGITKEGNDYYIGSFGRGFSNYYGTELKIKKNKKNKIEFVATSKFCKMDSIVTYGEGCKIDGYYEIEKPFIIVKKDNTWKVLEYTSVFQFTDREFK